MKPMCFVNQIIKTERKSKKYINKTSSNDKQYIVEKEGKG
jgi:hypothetical protein